MNTTFAFASFTKRSTTAWIWLNSSSYITICGFIVSPPRWSRDRAPEEPARCLGQAGTARAGPSVPRLIPETRGQGLERYHRAPILERERHTAPYLRMRLGTLLSVLYNLSL